MENTTNPLLKTFTTQNIDVLPTKYYNKISLDTVLPIKTVLFALAFYLALTVPAVAAPAKYIYDPAHTQIIFSTNHLGFSFPQGHFNSFSGSFIFDKENPEASKAEMTIKTDSIDLGFKKWNKHMRSEDFFNTKKFPTMVFKSTKVLITGKNTAKVVGDITLLGVTKPIVFAITFNKLGTHPLNKNKIAGFSAKASLKRSTFGMTYGLPGVADKVHLNIQVEGIRQDFEGLTP